MSKWSTLSFTEYKYVGDNRCDANLLAQERAILEREDTDLVERIRSKVIRQNYIEILLSGVI